MSSKPIHLLTIGAGGMIGRKLSEHLAHAGSIGDRALGKITLVDINAPSTLAAFAGEQMSIAADLSQEGVAETLIAERPDIIVHLAAIVSGEAEADFDKGYRINLDGTRKLFDGIRQLEDYTPRVIYASSLAVFGAPFPDVIPDDYYLTPLTSYGTQKAMGEMLLNDYSRRGFFDGIGIRFPTICIRPGAPNKAASGFFSGILREPLNGLQAILPVDDNVRHWFASPRSAVGYIEHAASINTHSLGAQRNMTMPGVSATVGEQIEALRHVAGDSAVALIKRAPDPVIETIVAGWPQNFDTTRALELGFRSESTFKEIIEVYLADEMGTAA